MTRFLQKPILKTSASRISWAILGLIFFLLPGGASWAEEVDEASLFSGEEGLIESEGSLQQNLSNTFEKESVTFSGRVMARGVYHMSREWLYEEGRFDTNQLSNASEGDFFIDVRLKNGVKGYVNVAIETIAQEPQPFLGAGVETESESESFRETEAWGSDTEERVKEFFIDANAGRKAYFRIGKQVLKWGRTYFWNPTDFINIEKREFLDMNRYREGVYGARLHVPFGSQQNLYLFTNFSSANNMDGVAMAGKYEFLIRNTELAFSAWHKSRTGNAVGFDFSTTLLGIYVNSETSFHHQDESVSIEGAWDHAALRKEKNKDAWRMSLGLTKTFDYELSDRITFTYECFYNGGGYEENLFNDAAATALLLLNDLYEPNHHGVYYSALFGSINKYPIPDMILNLNILSNMDDGSFVIVPGFSYEPVDHFIVSFNLDIFAGPENAEYTFLNTGVACDLSVEILF